MVDVFGLAGKRIQDGSQEKHIKSPSPCSQTLSFNYNLLSPISLLDLKPPNARHPLSILVTMLGLPTIVGLAALLSAHVQAYNIQAMLSDSNGRETRIDQTNPFLETPSIQSDDFGVMAAVPRRLPRQCYMRLR